MKKIKVFSSNCLSVWSQQVCYVTPINWILKLHHVKFSLSKNEYTWTEPYFLIGPEYYDLEAAYNMVVEENIDIVVFSIYIWNKYEFLKMAKFFKERNPNLIIIAGGPELDAHRDVDFFVKHSFLDYVIYGEGEIAFSRLMDHIAGHEVELLNVVSAEGGVSNHEPVNKKDEILKYSIYMEFEEEIAAFFNTFVEKKIFYALAWETTKGCPYLCTFCDWSSGLHHKVRIWGKDELIPPWKKELDMFSRLGVPSIYWTNPNVGLSHQDTEIVDYICDLKQTGKHTPIFISTQFSKTKKEHSYGLLDKMLTYQVTAGLKFDLQDLDPVVLDLIDRPEIEWNYHKTLIRKILDKHSKVKVWGERTNPVWCNFIWGLPGQTLNHMRRNMIESGELGMFPTHHIFELLPNSPAAAPEYQAKHGMKIKKIYLNVADGVKMHPGPISSHWANAVVEHNTLPNKDWFTGVFIFNLYGALTDYSGVMSDNRDTGLGKEGIYFDNTLDILQDIIDASYQHFMNTDRIEIFHGNQAYGFQNWVEARRDGLAALFSDDSNKKQDLITLLNYSVDEHFEHVHHTKYGLTPENLQNFIAEK